jgi:hypothetical protein
MSLTVIGRSFTKAELVKRLKTTEGHASALMLSSSAMLSVRQLKALEPNFKDLPRPEPKLKSKLQPVSKIRLPPSLTDLVVTTFNDEIHHRKVKLTWKGRTGTFKLNFPLNHTTKGILEDLFTFVDLLEPGFREHSRMKNWYKISPRLTEKKALRDRKALERIFRDQMPEFRALALLDSREVDDIYKSDTNKVTLKAPAHKRLPPLDYELRLFSGNPTDFVRLMESVDYLYEVREDPITKKVDYFTFLGELIGATYDSKCYVAYYKGVHPIDRPYKVAKSGFDLVPLFSENSNKPYSIYIETPCYNTHCEKYKNGEPTIRGAREMKSRYRYLEVLI